MNDNAELLEMLSELERRKMVCPIAAFGPNKGQKAYFLIKDTKAIIMILAGNRFGKTHLSVEEAISTALGYYPWMVPGFSLVRDRTNKRGWGFPERDSVPPESWVLRADGLPIAVPNRTIFVSGLSLQKGIGEIMQPKFESLWPMDKVEVHTDLYKNGVWSRVDLPNGSVMVLGSAQQDRMSFEGSAYDAAFVDEPVPRYVFTSLRRGLVDKNGKLVWTMTPLGDENIAWVVADILNGERNDVAIITGSGTDNEYLDQKRLEDYLNDPSLTEAERAARRNGTVGAIGKRIATTFDATRCVIPPTTIPDNVPRLMVVDPHHARPPCITWFAVMDDGERLIAYREWPTEDVEKAAPPAITNHDLAGTIKSLEGSECIRWRLADPQFGIAHAKVHGERYESFVEKMGGYGLLFDTRVDNDLERGIAKLRDAFRCSDVTGRPRLQIMSHLRNCLNSMTLWSYREGLSGQLVVGEKYKDFADTIRYALMYELPIFTTDNGVYSYIDEKDQANE